VSGSRDRTIRLWRMQDGVAVAAINAGVDVFRVLLSNNKKTIVALADRGASRKLIMLKVGALPLFILFEFCVCC